jgi:hypothetical protein
MRGLFDGQDAQDGPGLRGRLRPSAGVELEPGARREEMEERVTTTTTYACGIHAFYDPCPRSASIGSNSVAGVDFLWGLIDPARPVRWRRA